MLNFLRSKIHTWSTQKNNFSFTSICLNHVFFVITYFISLIKKKSSLLLLKNSLRSEIVYSNYYRDAKLHIYFNINALHLSYKCYKYVPKILIKFVRACWHYIEGLRNLRILLMVDVRRSSALRQVQDRL